MAFVCKQTAVLVVRINKIGKEKWCFNRLVVYINNKVGGHCRGEYVNNKVSGHCTGEE